MLYKVFQSANYPNPTGVSLSCMWVTREATPTGLTKIYALTVEPYFGTSIFHLPWVYVICCWDGQTGNLLWLDDKTYDRWTNHFELDPGNNRNRFADETGRLWTYDVLSASLSRMATITEAVGLEPSGQAGMPNLLVYDYACLDSLWKDETGTEPASAYPVWKPIALSWTGQWVIGSYMDGWEIGGEQPPSPCYLAVHDLVSGNRLGYVKLRNVPYAGVVVDSTTAYIFGEAGTVEIVDVVRMLNLGILELGDLNLLSGGAASIGDNGLFVPAYDPIYRRILTMVAGPDVTEVNVKGYIPKQVAERVTKPLPLSAPREDRVVPVVSRVYGWGGEGVGGEQLTFSVDSIYGTLAPNPQSSDGIGAVRTLWVCGDSTMLAEADLSVSVNTEQELPGIASGTYTPYMVGVCPAKIIEGAQEEFFYPGWWLSSRATASARTQTAAQAFGPYLADVASENPFVGALVEYTWKGVEVSESNYSTSEILTDLAYLKSQGMKMIIALRACDYQAGSGEAWVPEYLLNDISGLYPAANNAEGFVSGVFAPSNSTTGNFSTIYPMIFNPTIRAKYISFAQAVATAVIDDPDVVGFVFINTPYIISNGVKYATPITNEYALADWWAAKRLIMQSVVVGGRPIYDWVGPDTVPVVSDLDAERARDDNLSSSHSSHVAWCAEQGIGLLAPFWYTDNNDYVRSCKWFSDNAIFPFWSQVSTGIQVPDWVWGHWRNVDCNGATATPLMTLLDQATLLLGGCSSRYMLHVDSAYPWMHLLEASGGYWAGAGGILGTCTTKRTYMHKRFYG